MQDFYYFLRSLPPSISVRNQIASLIVAILLSLTYTTAWAQAYPYTNTSAPLDAAAWNSGLPTTVVFPRANSCGNLNGGRAYVQLSSGVSHSTGKTPFTIPQISVLVTFSVNNAGGLSPSNYTRTLNISNDSPEMQAMLDIPPRFFPAAGTTSAPVSSMTVWVRVKSQGTPTGTLPANRQIVLRVEPEYDISALPKPMLTTPTIAVGAFEQTLAWTLPSTDCDLVRSYQVQMLHRPVLFPAGNPLPQDWAQQGQLLETGSSALSYQLTLAEGEGTYYWRVRSLGNKDGGIANPSNWGTWSTTGSFSVLPPNPALNWIYTRTFADGGRVTEKLTVANGLQQVRQVQTRLASPGQNESVLGQQTVTAQTVQDYSGRDAVNSLPIPIAGDGALGYKKKLLYRKSEPITATSDTSGYNAAHFDSEDNATVLEPVPALERNYYSSATLANNDRVPDAEGYPFTRSMYANDGTNRVSAEGGAGATLHYRSALTASGTAATVTPRTVRTDYTDVAPMELIRVFGREAPESGAAYKIIATDANGVSTVTYQSKEGQTLATALSRAGVVDSTLLVPLPSASDDAFSITHSIAGQGRIIGKPLVLTEPTSITLNYSITPSTIAASCAEYYCATCDYQVRLRIVNSQAAPGANPFWQTTLVVAASQSCSPTATSLPTTAIPQLPAGTYRIERELVPLNYYSLPTGSTATPKLLADHLLDLRAYINTHTLGTPTAGSIWSVVKTRLENAQMSELYRDLDDLGCQQGTDTEGRYYIVPLDGSAGYTNGCARAFKIRIISLLCAPQLPFGMTYAQELRDRLTSLNGSGQLNPQGLTITPLDLIPGFTDAGINDLLQNMMTKAGTNQTRMDEVRNCWVTLLNNLATTVYSPPVGAERLTYNLLNDFLECTGVQMTTPVSSANGGAVALDRADEQFLYDPALHKDCFMGVYTQLLPQNQIPDPTTVTISQIIAAINAQPLTSANPNVLTRTECFNSVYHCIKNVQNNPTPAPQVVSNVQLANEFKVQIETQCRTTCASRWAEFVTSVVEEFHRTNRYVENDVYTWAVGSNGVPVMTSTLLSPAQQTARIDSCQIYTMAQELVNQCQNTDCSLTVAEIKNSSQQIIGYQVGSQAEMDRMKKAMFAPVRLRIDLNGSCPTCDVSCNFVGDTGYTPVAKLSGTTYQHVNLTRSATSIIQYMSEVFNGANRLMANPGRPVPAANYSPGFHEYVLNASATGPSNVFDYKGPLLALDFPYKSFEPWASLPTYGLPVPENYLIQIRDDRNISSPRPADLPATEYNPAQDFLLIWRADGVDCPTCRPAPSPVKGKTIAGKTTGAAFGRLTAEGAAKADTTAVAPTETASKTATMIYGGGYSDIVPTLSGLDIAHYIIRFTNSQTSQVISKNDISAILPGATLLNNTQPLPTDLADVFSSGFVQVQLRLTNGSLITANVVARAYNSNAQTWSSPDPTSRMILWKRTGRTCTSSNRNYTMCYRWEDVAVITPPTGDEVFTNQPLSCVQQVVQRVKAELAQQISDWEQAETALVSNRFADQCVALKNQQESFSVTYNLGYYHYTLYYYDRAGNLVMTVPPAGVKPATLAQTTAVNVTNRATWPTLTHELPTTYTYNSLHQLVAQQSPDGGASQFYYNSKGQLRVSQNARQSAIGVYSYTRYDALGRVIEVGESRQGVTTGIILQPMPDAARARTAKTGTAVNNANTSAARQSSQAPATTAGVATANITQPTIYSLATVLASLDDPSFPSSVPTSGAPLRWQITRTFYTDAFPGLTYLGVAVTAGGKPQRNLQNRVSYGYVDVDGDLNTTTDRSSTYYSYDPHGNVEWLAQEQTGLGLRYIAYEYDLISNKVLKVLYQEGQTADQFYHRYSYDADNRLTKVFTSADNVIWDQDASYEYYAHGPLKRMVVGEDQVQGIDYTYTLQGWLKGINHPTADPGADGTGTGQNAVAADAFGMALGYFPNDYKSNSTLWTSNISALREPQAGGANDNSAGLYNGNIATWTSHTRNDINSLGNVTAEPTMAEQFRYDQLNRLIRSNSYEYGNGSFTQSPNYLTKYSYDPNGNLLSLDRNGSTNVGQLPMDRLTYGYFPGTNQLKRVEDGVVPLDPNLYNDIRPATISKADGQYAYDAIGNLTKSAEDGVTLIQWNVYNKITRVEMSKVVGRGTETHITTYRYDAAGNRIAKVMQNGTQNGIYETQTTYYVRDAQGNVLSTYNQTTVTNGATGAIALLEQSIYGSSRLGVRRPSVAANLGAGYYARNIGQKQYEFTDHLNNVRAVVSDVKLPDTGGTYKPDLLAYFNYYPFGMTRPERYAISNATANGGYRYGFNGKEKDNNGELGMTNYDYGLRIYNPGLGRFLSVDPLTKGYPMLTPYQFASNSPVAGVDLDGLEFKLVIQELAYHRDGTLFVVKTKTDIHRDFHVTDIHGNNYARTLVVRRLNGKIHNEYQFDERIPDFPGQVPIPSAAYDYTKGAIEGKLQQDSKYINTVGILEAGPRAAEILRRDINAPDNATTMDDTGDGMQAALSVFPYKIYTAREYRKHLPAPIRQSSWKDQVKRTSDGGASIFNPEIDADAITAEAWENGISSSTRPDHRYYKFERVIGASMGEETVYLRAEGTNGGGHAVVHGHPVPESEYLKHTKHTRLK